jgi:hypothetical protein
MKLTEAQKQEVETTITSLKKSLEQVIGQANRQIAHIEGRIGQLEELLVDEEPIKEEPIK